MVSRGINSPNKNWSPLLCGCFPLPTPIPTQYDDFKIFTQLLAPPSPVIIKTMTKQQTQFPTTNFPQDVCPHHKNFPML